MKKAVRLTLTGTVQSLFFREYLKDNAIANELKGFLRKLENGKVEVFLQGEQDNVDAMIDVCKTGPKYATIRDVQIKEEKLQDFPDFRILSF
jgi:acylphosphatase